VAGKSCQDCKHHMGCTPKPQGFLGCQCRKHEHPLKMSKYQAIDKRPCATSTWHYGKADCPDWKPKSRRRPKMGWDIKLEVAELHGLRCFFCKRVIEGSIVDDPDVILHHLDRFCDGGSNEPKNLYLAHRACHDDYHRKH
jgi:hypothetical protein